MCRQILETWPDQRIMILSHVKELLDQNHSKIKAFWPKAPTGLFCAGLGEKRTRDPITVASIQSVYRKPHIFGWRDLVIIDEAHLLSNDSDSMYRKFIDGLKQTNRRVKVIGLTATPYRMKTGVLTEGKGRLFTDIAYEITLPELLASRHIAPLISKSSIIQADLTGVRITAGEFNSRDLGAAMDKAALTRAALDEVFPLAADRRSWLFFCAGVEHARHVCEAIRERGVTAACVTGETPHEEREAILTGFKAGSIRAVTNAQVLTTGFDAPNIDLIVMLRPTMSPGLWLQMLGRGLRIAPGKENCLVLDYTDTTERLGPITHIKPPRTAGSRGKREAHAATCLICPECRMASPLEAKECAECGFEFPERVRQVKHETRASEAEVMLLSQEATEWMSVTSVRYIRHQKEGKLPTLRVEYRCGVRRVSQWICIEHLEGSFPRRKAEEWWGLRCGLPMPASVGAAVTQSPMLLVPERIQARRNGEFWEIVGYEFGAQGQLLHPTPANTPHRAA